MATSNNYVVMVYQVRFAFIEWKNLSHFSFINFFINEIRMHMAFYDGCHEQQRTAKWKS